MSTSSLATDKHPAAGSGPPRAETIAGLISFEAITVAVFSVLHLSGTLHVGSGSGSGTGAGIPEAVICVALLIGAAALKRAPERGGARIALFSTYFAILGFVVGLTFTIRGGDAIDLTYHAVMLPILVATAVVLVRYRRRTAAVSSGRDT
jgi:hypothetical protein